MSTINVIPHARDKCKESTEMRTRLLQSKVVPYIMQQINTASSSGNFEITVKMCNLCNLVDYPLKSEDISVLFTEKGYVVVKMDTIEDYIKFSWCDIK